MTEILKNDLLITHGVKYILLSGVKHLLSAPEIELVDFLSSCKIASINIDQNCRSENIKSIRISIVALLILNLLSCTSSISNQDGIKEESSLIEIADLYSAGHQQLEAAILTAPMLGNMLDTNLAATLLITLVIEYDDGEKERVQQSGCFIRDGRYILTAAHGFYVEGGKLIGLEAQTIKRQKVDLSVVAMGYSKDEFTKEDWAILKLVEPRPSKGLVLNEKAFNGGDVYLLGYPGGMALDDSNRVVHALEVEKGATYPLAMICERSITRPNILTPRVGAIPIRGMSGAPVLSEEGKLLGMFSSISRTRGATGWHYIFHMSDIPFETLDSLSQK